MNKVYFYIKKCPIECFFLVFTDKAKVNLNIWQLKINKCFNNDNNEYSTSDFKQIFELVLVQVALKVIIAYMSLFSSMGQNRKFGNNCIRL